MGGEFELEGAVGVALRDLQDIASEAGARWRWLAPLGGARWTPEDSERALSILYTEATAPGFRRALSRGMSRTCARRYLLVALYHRLLDRRLPSRRRRLLSSMEMDRLPAKDRASPGLMPEDRVILADRVLARLGRTTRVVAHEWHLRVDASSGRRTDREVLVPPGRTRDRHRARYRRAVAAVVSEAGLGREECLDLLSELADRLLCRRAPGLEGKAARAETEHR